MQFTQRTIQGYVARYIVRKGRSSLLPLQTMYLPTLVSPVWMPSLSSSS